MANAMTLQEALNVFERFDKELSLETYTWEGENSTTFREQLSLNYTRDGVRIVGDITYSYELLNPKPRGGDISVVLRVDGSDVFREDFHNGYSEGFFGGRYTFSSEMRLIIAFIRKTDVPLRNKKSRKARILQESAKQEKIEAVNRLRQAMR